MTPYQKIKQAHRGLAQQMILWGHDVKHPAGNALQRFGMQRMASTGLQGTSCYCMEWENGTIQLHGAVASWHRHASHHTSGCLYCRKGRKIKIWDDAHAPVPGTDTGTLGSPEQCWQAFQPMLHWLIAYETWVLEQLGSTWRKNTWRAQFSLVKKSPWLPPNEALAWWKQHSEKCLI